MHQRAFHWKPAGLPIETRGTTCAGLQQLQLRGAHGARAGGVHDPLARRNRWAHVATGFSKSKSYPVSINQSTKIGSNMGGEFTYPKMVPVVLTHSHTGPGFVSLSLSLSLDWISSGAPHGQLPRAGGRLRRRLRLHLEVQRAVRVGDGLLFGAIRSGVGQHAKRQTTPNKNNSSLFLKIYVCMLCVSLVAVVVQRETCPKNSKQIVPGHLTL